MADGYRGFAPADDSGAYPSGEGELAGHLAAGPRLEAPATAEALERDPHTSGRWAAVFCEGGPRALIFEQSGDSPALEEGQQAESRAAVQELPASAGIDLANWNWRAVHRFIREHFGLSLCRSSCLNCLYRLGFAFKRPKKRLIKADEVKREAFVPEYAALVDQVERTGGKTFFADEAHFRADAELQGKWTLKGEPALAHSTSPRHRGEALQEYLQKPERDLRLVNLPGYSPDFNADEAIWGWPREEATVNLCLGTRAAVQERVGSFLSGLASQMR